MLKSEIFKSRENQSFDDIAYSFYPILLWDFVGLSFYRNSKEYQEQDLYSNLISWQKKYNKKKNSKEISLVKTYGQKTQRRYHSKKYILKKLKGHIMARNIYSKRNSKEMFWLEMYSQNLKGHCMSENIWLTILPSYVSPMTTAEEGNPF